MIRYLLLFLMVPFAGQLNAQQKETIYILFDSSAEGNYVFEGDNYKKFYVTPKIHADYFITNQNLTIEKSKFSEVKCKLVSKAEANKKVRDYLELKALDFERQTGLKGNIIRNSPYNFDDYFTEIFVYEKIDENWGYLYKVSWKYAIQ